MVGTLSKAEVAALFHSLVTGWGPFTPMSFEEARKATLHSQWMRHPQREVERLALERTRGHVRCFTHDAVCYANGFVYTPIGDFIEGCPACDQVKAHVSAFVEAENAIFERDYEFFSTFGFWPTVLEP